MTLARDVPDIVLMARLAHGETEAFGLLYDRHAKRLLRLAIRVVGDRSEAEDVTHDAFVIVAARASQYVADRGAVSAWLTALVRNLSIDRAKLRRRHRSIAERVSLQEPLVRVADPERLMCEAVERHKVQRALQRLPPTYRTTLEAAFFEGLNYREMAERDGIPLGTVKSRAARAFPMFGKACEEEGLK